MDASQVDSSVYPTHDEFHRHSGQLYLKTEHINC